VTTLRFNQAMAKITPVVVMVKATIHDVLIVSEGVLLPYSMKKKNSVVTEKSVKRNSEKSHAAVVRNSSTLILVSVAKTVIMTDQRVMRSHVAVRIYTMPRRRFVVRTMYNRDSMASIQAVV